MYNSRHCAVYGLLRSQGFSLSLFLLVALKIPSALALDEFLQGKGQNKKEK